jgi:hypothetical protein
LHHGETARGAAVSNWDSHAARNSTFSRLIGAIHRLFLFSAITFDRKLIDLAVARHQGEVMIHVHESGDGRDLIEKAHFEPQIAVAVAQAMDEAMEGKIRESQWMTVPILDSRMAELKSELRTEMHEIKSDIVRQLYTAILGQFALLLGIAYFFVSHVSR